MHIIQCYSGPVPPLGYGGVERMVYWLVQAFVAAGHKITLVADESSNISNHFDEVEFIPYQRISQPGFRFPAADIVHFHNDFVPNIYGDMPYIVTEHGNRKKFRGHTRNTVFLSQSHARNHHAHYFVPNGVPLDEYPMIAEKKDFLLFMAKLGWRTKNAKTAINLSLDSKMPLVLTGGKLSDAYKIWGSWLLRYFINPGLIRNAGNVAGAEKLDLLQNARLLFYLVNWQEPFALAPHEALACGTPVLASPNGALAEYIEDSKNGFLVKNYQEALVAIRKVQSMSADELAVMAKNCRASAYSIENSARAYLDMYHKIIEHGFLYTDKEVKAIYFDPPCSVVIQK